jgi:hypothetical protein
VRPQSQQIQRDKSRGGARSSLPAVAIGWLASFFQSSAPEARRTHLDEGQTMNKNLIPQTAQNYVARVVAHDSIKKGAAGFIAAALFAVISEALFPSSTRG